MQIEHDIMEMLGCATIAQPGQAVFTVDTLWVVPPGVFLISAVAMQRGTVSGESWPTVPASRIARAGVDLLRAQNGNRLGDGGGEGGFSGGSTSQTYDGGGADYGYYGGGGGGGGGGYGGPGGDGGTALHPDSGGNAAMWVGKAAAANSGGGGGAMCGTIFYAPGGGGGVGLNGVGSSGAGVSAWPSSANPGSNGGYGGATTSGGSWAVGENGAIGGNYGGAQGDKRGAASYASRGRGGANAWANNIAVYPGETLQIYVQGNGGVRVLWGGDLFYPNNAGNL